MKVCFIGCSGHYSYTFDILKSHTVAGIAPGTNGEDMRPLINDLKRMDISFKSYDHYAQMLDECRPDIAVINTWFGLSAPPVLAAVQRGIHVFTEKPVCTDMDNLLQIAGALKKTKTELCAMLGLRFDPWFLCMDRAVKDGAIGDIRLITGQKSYRMGSRPAFYSKRELFGGLIPWVAIHAIDWAYCVSGSRFQTVAACHSAKANHGCGDLEMTAACSFTMENDIIVSITADYLRPEKAPTHGDDRLRVAGTAGVIEAINGRVTLIDGQGSRELPLPEPGNVFTAFVQKLHGEKNNSISAYDSLYTTAVALKARDAADQKTLLDIHELDKLL